MAARFGESGNLRSPADLSKATLRNQQDNKLMM